MKKPLLLLSCLLCLLTVVGPQPLSAHAPESADTAVVLNGFQSGRYFNERERLFRMAGDVRIYINAPAAELFDAARPTAIVLFALPNGNTIEQTAGKCMEPGDDWHFDIQHIAAQTRFLRGQIREHNLVVAYLENDRRSWPAWKRHHGDSGQRIDAIVDTLKAIFRPWQPFICLNGHSGGGSFIFGYLDEHRKVPAGVRRIAFLDSDYGYEARHGAMLSDWLKGSPERRLCVLAYNDSIALYQGKPFVSATGGTWYRSQMMQRDLAGNIPFESRENDSLIHHRALDGRVQIILRKNPARAIYHTVQVARNGFIHSMLSGTPADQHGYRYYGARAYEPFIAGETPAPRPLDIPPRPAGARSGGDFMRYLATLDGRQREGAIAAEIISGNMPDFLRRTPMIHTSFLDADSQAHTVTYEVLPDYLAVGSDSNFCRIPMTPQAAQRIADRFGASLPTARLVDDIYRHATFTPAPVTDYPEGSANETIEKFVAHQRAIEQQRDSAGFAPGVFIAGIKKDVVISNKIADPARARHVTIYGWHRLDGCPIQPLTNIHSDGYVDYSHGIRLINAEIMLDGLPVAIGNILSDSVLYKMLSDETGIMKQPFYGR